MTPGLWAARVDPTDYLRTEFLALQDRAATVLDLLGARRLDGEELTELPGSEQFALLQALLVNPGHVVSRRELLAALPGGTAASEHAVEMAVARLRAALGTRLVQTVVKRGYRLAVTSS